MIKVNLLREQTTRVRRKIAAPRVSRMGLLMVVALGLIAAGLAIWWYMLGREVDSLTQTRDRLRAESIRVAALSKEIQEYETLGKLQARRIEVLESLRSAQTDPVELLSHVLRSLPTTGPLWLTLVEQRGDRIQIAGRCVNGEAVPPLIANLAATGYFASVDLELLHNEGDQTRFVLRCVSARKPTRE